MKVALIFRSKKLGYHSIENVFDTVREKLAGKVELLSVYVDEPGFSANNILELRKFVKTRDSDTIYHVTGDIQYVVFALPRRRTILTIHDCVFINKTKGLKRWILKKLYLDWPVRYVRAITAISEKTKSEVVALTGCNPDKISVINNPVASHIRFKERPFNNEHPALLFIGSQPNKNLNRVIESLAGFPCSLNIVGHVDDQQLAKLRQFGIRHVVENFLLKEEIADRYEKADIIVFPSLYEGFGLPIIEGFKAGRAVLTSEISPMKEVSDGAAWLVDPYSISSIRSTLERIVKDADTREKKIKNGLYIVQEYLPENVASSYFLAYSNLIAANSVAITSN